MPIGLPAPTGCRPDLEVVALSASTRSSPAANRSAAPTITAAVAGVILVALLVVYFAILRPAKKDLAGGGGSAGALTGTEQKAVLAASTEIANLLTFRRAHFAADYARAVSGATGGLRKDVVSKKAATLTAITAGKFDLGARVLHQALEGPTEGTTKGYLVLVSVNAFRSTAQATPVLQNLEVTVVSVKGTWLASGVTSIAVQ